MLFWLRVGTRVGVCGLAEGGTDIDMVTGEGTGMDTETGRGTGSVGGWTGAGKTGPGCWIGARADVNDSGSTGAMGLCRGVGGRGLFTSTTVRFSGLGTGCSILKEIGRQTQRLGNYLYPTFLPECHPRWLSLSCLCEISILVCNPH